MENRNQGQWVKYWRDKLSETFQERHSLPHGIYRKMSVAHPLRVLKGWLAEAQKNPDGSPIQWPAIYIE